MTRTLKAKLFLGALLLLMGGRNAIPQDIAKQKQALDIISQFAASLCDSVKAHGKTEAWEVSGDAKAELSGVVKQIADLGVGSAAKYTSSEYEGVLQSDLGKTLDNQTNCRLSVFKDLQNKLLPGPQKQGSLTPEPTDTLVLVSPEIVTFRDLRMTMKDRDFDQIMVKKGFHLVEQSEADLRMYETPTDPEGILKTLVVGFFDNHKLSRISREETVRYERPKPVTLSRQGGAVRVMCDEQSALPLKLELLLGKPYQEHGGYKESEIPDDYISLSARHVVIYARPGRPSVTFTHKIYKTVKYSPIDKDRTEKGLFSSGIYELNEYGSRNVICESKVDVDNDPSSGIDFYLSETADRFDEKPFQQ